MPVKSVRDRRDLKAIPSGTMNSGRGRSMAMFPPLLNSYHQGSIILKSNILKGPVGGGLVDGVDQIFSTFKIAAVSARVLRQASASRVSSIPYVRMICFSPWRQTHS